MYTSGWGDELVFSFCILVQRDAMGQQWLTNFASFLLDSYTFDLIIIITIIVIVVTVFATLTYTSSSSSPFHIFSRHYRLPHPPPPPTLRLLSLTSLSMWFSSTAFASFHSCTSFILAPLPSFLRSPHPRSTSTTINFPLLPFFSPLSLPFPRFLFSASYSFLFLFSIPLCLVHLFSFVSTHKSISSSPQARQGDIAAGATLANLDRQASRIQPLNRVPSIIGARRKQERVRRGPRPRL
ncbi:hypothetical protein IE81DRAFT_188328 [Ceraceosorus guamensis]|uniref:Uncharacterized protein n=1 Tax=Ceraceosorus guamensis TaxID=1522189 RepID=A0A316VVZ8_9BASI|nr:hypothetical protein IE81DRAFT_188328 [Ceraceosorus guamensis]PWN41118.1 hypothetical protein IE81DRAFT_188328 [Ceraceosorus guamensis]